MARPLCKSKPETVNSNRKSLNKYKLISPSRRSEDRREEGMERQSTMDGVFALLGALEDKQGRRTAGGKVGEGSGEREGILNE